MLSVFQPTPGNMNSGNAALHLVARGGTRESQMAVSSVASMGGGEGSLLPPPDITTHGLTIQMAT